jgi:hypothetical protein
MRKVAAMTIVDDDPSTEVTSFHRQAKRALVVVTLVILGGLGLAQADHVFTSSANATLNLSSPTAATLSWFSDVNARDLSLAEAHFTPATRDMTHWSTWPPVFRDLHCSLWTHTASTANVYCSFATQNDANAGESNLSFWTFSLRRTSAHQWLINNYGQG